MLDNLVRFREVRCSNVLRVAKGVFSKQSLPSINTKAFFAKQKVRKESVSIPQCGFLSAGFAQWAFISFMNFYYNYLYFNFWARWSIILGGDKPEILIASDGG